MRRADLTVLAAVCSKKDDASSTLTTTATTATAKAGTPAPPAEKAAPAAAAPAAGVEVSPGRTSRGSPSPALLPSEPDHH